MRVLVVDDDRTTRFLLRRALVGEFGCTVTEAEDGNEAIQALAAARHHLVILDVQMPVMDGLQTLRAVRGAPALADLPVMMLTAERSEAVVREIVSLGVLDYMAKPLNPDRLAARLGRVVKWLGADREAVNSRPADGHPCPLDGDATVLLVDGDEAFRRFFVETLGGRCEVRVAESGSHTLRLCVDKVPAALFVGRDLGIVNEALLLKKLSSTPALQNLQVFAVVGPDENRRAEGYHGRVVRTLDREQFLREVEGLWTADAARVPERLAVQPALRVHLIAAVEQVIGMMLSGEVVLCDSPLPATAVVAVSATAQWSDRPGLRLHVCADIPTGQEMAASMLGIDGSMVGAEDVDAAMSEIFGMVAHRLRYAMVGKRVPLSFDTPTVLRAPGTTLTVPRGTFSFYCQSGNRRLPFWVLLEHAEDGDTREVASSQHAA